MADQIILPRPVLDATGAPVASAQAYFYQSGTTTPLTVYSDDALTTQHPTPLVADSNGVFAQAFVAAGTAVRLTILDPDTGAALPGYNALDPAYIAIGVTSTAGGITFSPITGNTATNVQAAIKVNTDRHENRSTSVKAFLDDDSLTEMRSTLGLGEAALLDLASIAQAEAGTTNTTIMTPLRTSAAIDALSPISAKSYESAEQTITAAGALTLAHGLGVAPKIVNYVLVCKTGEAGYSVNDVIGPFGMRDDAAGTDHGVSFTLDATNITVRYGAEATTFAVVNATTGVRANLTNANWRMIVRAWA